MKVVPLDSVGRSGCGKWKRLERVVVRGTHRKESHLRGLWTIVERKGRRYENRMRWIAKPKPGRITKSREVVTQEVAAARARIASNKSLLDDEVYDRRERWGLVDFSPAEVTAGAGGPNSPLPSPVEIGRNPSNEEILRRRKEILRRRKEKRNRRRLGKDQVEPKHAVRVGGNEEAEEEEAGMTDYINRDVGGAMDLDSLVLWGGANSDHADAWLRIRRPFLDENDKSILLEKEEDKAKADGGGGGEGKKISKRAEDFWKSLGPNTQNPFNISQDANYTRPTLIKGDAHVSHSLAALKLEDALFPYYVGFPANEWHRPLLILPRRSRSEWFSVRPEGGCQMEESGGGTERVMLPPKWQDDLTATEGTIILFEYLEQNPPVVSNVGMGSRLLTYLRSKRKSKELPVAQEGQVQVLDDRDPSPFHLVGFL